jgi:hypothetical protein
MPINNFKLFDEKKANMMSDDDYAINQQRLNGVQSGVASSQLQNKTLYQTALMCYALAQLMAANGYDANDANAVSTFVNNLSRSMVQKVVDKASANDVANKVSGKWVDAKQLGELKKDIADNYLPLLGGTMLGDLLLNRDPISSLQAATKQYVDGRDKLILIDDIITTSINQKITVDFSSIDMKKLSCIMIISGVAASGSGVSDKAVVTGKVSGKVLFETIEAMGGQEISITFIIHRPKRVTDGTKYCGAFSVGAKFNRNDSNSFASVVTKSDISFDSIKTIDFEFIGNTNSFATIYGLMK